jgi:HTH domain
MVMVRPVAPTQPHLARLRVERQHRLIEELRLAARRYATAEELAAALRVDVRTVERDIARLRDIGVPSPPAADPAAASASTCRQRSPRSGCLPARSPP